MLYPLFSAGYIFSRNVALLDAIFPSNSKKKLLYKKIIVMIPSFLASAFIRREQHLEIKKILDLVYGINKSKDISDFIIYSNASRNPQRIYVWFCFLGMWFFVKILKEDCDIINFDLECSARDLLKEVLPHVKSPAPLSFGEYMSWKYILYTGIPPEDLVRKVTLKTYNKELFSNEISMIKDMHPDFNSENAFVIDDKLYIVDWELVE
jgi:hypothetical protein